jgi:hypothetical protein
MEGKREESRCVMMRRGEETKDGILKVKSKYILFGCVYLRNDVSIPSRCKQKKIGSSRNKAPET